jgi:hypothetical protein
LVEVILTDRRCESSLLLGQFVISVVDVDEQWRQSDGEWKLKFGQLSRECSGVRTSCSVRKRIFVVRFSTRRMRSWSN